MINPQAPGWNLENDAVTEWQSYRDFRYGFVKDLAWVEERIKELKYDEIMLMTAIIRDEMISLQLAGGTLG